MKLHDVKLKSKPKLYIVTVSTSRYNKVLSGLGYTDQSGDYVEEAFRRRGVEDITRVVIKDDVKMIREVVDRARAEGVHMMIFIGGTGVSPDDVTIESLKPLFTRELPAFQVLFTLYSSEEVGSRAISSRASAGFVGKTLVFALPGSLNAVRTAIDRIILDEYEHLLYIAGILE